VLPGITGCTNLTSQIQSVLSHEIHHGFDYIKQLKSKSKMYTKIKNQKICIFGLDDVWSETPNFDSAPTSTTPLIFLTHNPDGILDWPANLRAPDLVLSGHTHGGQVYLPFVGPLADAGIKLPKKFYRGLNEYNGIPIYTTVGAGESGGAIRFWTLPEIVIINLKPQE